MTKIHYGTKKIIASPMTRQAYNSYRGWALPDDEDGSDAGYLVEYVDGGASNHPDHAGYISWSPSDVFERSYQPDTALSFGHAIAAMKEGHKVARAGWNGKGMSISRIDGGYHQYNTHFLIKQVDGSLSTWVPSVGDCEADDWHIAED